MTDENTDSDTTVLCRFDNLTDGGSAVYESSDVGGSQLVTGFYVSGFVLDKHNDGEAWDAIEVAIGGDTGIPVTLDRTTSQYAVYNSENDAIKAVYIHEDLVGSEEPPEELNLSISPADIEDFEAQVEADRAEAESEANDLLA